MLHRTVSEKKKPIINIVIPMSGEGSRFANVGFMNPKPMIKIGGRPMINWVIENLKPNEFDPHYIFVVQKSHEKKHNISTKLKKQAKNVTVVITDVLTEGPLCTCLLAKHLIDSKHPLMIANSDQYLEWDVNTFIRQVCSTTIDGGIVTFFVPPSLNDTRWSYVKKSQSTGYVVECQEKKVISDEATVGVYWFSHGNDFVRYAERMVKKNVRVNNEFYVCPVYNEGISDGQKYVCFKCDRMWGLGVPDDARAFQSGFLNWSKSEIEIWEKNEKTEYQE